MSGNHKKILIGYAWSLWIVLTAECNTLQSEDRYSRYIWSFYDPFDTPGVDRITQHTKEVLNRDWKYRYITNENVSSFLNVSTFPPHYYQLSPAHQSDYLRLRLAEKYGGWWIDGDMLVSSSKYFEDIYNIMKTEKKEFFACCIICPRKAIENGFFYAPKGSILIKHWLSELEREHSIGQKNYFYDIDNKGVTTTYYSWKKYPEVDTYLSSHVALQYVLERLIPRNTSMLIYKSAETHYKLINDCNGQTECIKKQTLKQFENGTYPITKFIHPLRDVLWPGGEHVRWTDKEPFEYKPGISYKSKYVQKLFDTAFRALIHSLFILGLIILRSFVKRSKSKGMT